MYATSLVIGLWNWLYLKNRQMEWTGFLHAGANSGKLKVISMIFGSGMVKNCWDHLVQETLLYLRNEFMIWADFLHADYDAVIFG